LEDNVINYEIKIGYEYAADEISPVTGFTGNGELILDPVTNTFDLDGIVGQPEVSTGIYKTYQATMGVNGSILTKLIYLNHIILNINSMILMVIY